MREWSRKARGYTAYTEDEGRHMGSNAEEGAALLCALLGIAAHTPLPDFRGVELYNPEF